MRGRRGAPSVTVRSALVAAICSPLVAGAAAAARPHVLPPGAPATGRWTTGGGFVGSFIVTGRYNVVGLHGTIVTAKGDCDGGSIWVPEALKIARAAGRIPHLSGRLPAHYSEWAVGTNEPRNPNGPVLPIHGIAMHYDEQPYKGEVLVAFPPGAGRNAGGSITLSGPEFDCAFTFSISPS